ncbi:MAG TPA: protein kinase [Gemmataceae bacterium]|nr:protein kinase [Gemmataceae bacterium]
MKVNPQPDEPQPSHPSAARQGLPLPDLAPSAVLAPGAEPLPGYQLIRFLGKGGYGEVWQARGPGDFDIALKFVRISQAEATGVELRALEVMKSLHHPHILPLFGAWQTPDFLIIGMELASGTLLDRLRKAQEQGLPGIPLDELLEYLREAAKAIDFLNERRHRAPDGKLVGIQHRDVKPQNLLIVGNSVKVADFGLVLALVATIGPVPDAMTLAYAAPESFDGKATRWSDQYSLGVTYCELRGGKLPFEGNRGQLIRGHMMEPPDLSMVPEMERAVVNRALAKKPTDRWNNCRDFVGALAAVNIPPGPVSPSHPELPLIVTPGPAKRRRWKLTAAAIVSLVGLGAVVGLMAQGDASTPTGGKVSLGSLKPVTVQVGTSVPLEVRLRREGTVPMVRLEAEGLPAQVRVEPITLGASQDVAELMVTADAGALPTSEPIRVSVVATVGHPRPVGHDSPPKSDFQLTVTFNKAQQHRVVDWVRGLKGKAVPDGAVVRTVDLFGIPVTDADLARLQGLHHLRELTLTPRGQVTNWGLRSLKSLVALEKLELPAAAVTDAGLEHLAGLKQLRELNLWNCAGVGDEGLRHLRGLTALQKLSLGSTAVTDAGLEHLAGLRDLRELHLDQCPQVGDKGLEHLKDLQGLEKLELRLTAVTAAGLERLKGLTRLHELNLAGCKKIGDNGLQHLTALPALRTLVLCSTLVTDNGLKHLAGLKGLQKLHLSGTKVTPEGIADLLRASPELKVWQ